MNFIDIGIWYGRLLQLCAKNGLWLAVDWSDNGNEFEVTVSGQGEGETPHFLYIKRAFDMKHAYERLVERISETNAEGKYVYLLGEQ